MRFKDFTRRIAASLADPAHPAGPLALIKAGKSQFQIQYFLHETYTGSRGMTTSLGMRVLARLWGASLDAGGFAVMNGAIQRFGEAISPQSGVFPGCRTVIESGWIREHLVPLEVLVRGAEEASVKALDFQACFVFRRSGDGIRFCAYTKSVESLVGAGARAFLGMSVKELYGTRPGLTEVLTLCLERRERLHWEGWYTFHSDGSTRYVDAWCACSSHDLVFVTGEDRTDQHVFDAVNNKQGPESPGEVRYRAELHSSVSSAWAGSPGIFIFTARSNNSFSLEFLNNRAAFILDYCDDLAPSFPACIEAILPEDDQQRFLDAMRHATFTCSAFRWESPMPGLRGMQLVVEAWPEAQANPGMRYFGTIILRQATGQAIKDAEALSPSSTSTTIHGRLSDLSRRELEVAACLLRGMSNAEIARELFIQECTVKKHVTSIFFKTGSDGRVEFILRFADSGLEHSSDLLPERWKIVPAYS